MKLDFITKSLLTFIAVLLILNVLQSLASPPPVYAQHTKDLYIEPGTSMLRAPDGSQQIMGKVVIDRRTGKVWGFPTLTEKPYPVDTVRTVPPVSRPIYLGQFDFSAITE
ncbi:MAG TPA: hypothetical protein VKT29_17755 [Terriglobales bacterium]|nr:hypothetical protein [Terriglobales bacterium]